MVDSLHVRGILTKGDTITYALGLMVTAYRGVPMVEHSGATGRRQERPKHPDQCDRAGCRPESGPSDVHAPVEQDEHEGNSDDPLDGAVRRDR